MATNVYFNNFGHTRTQDLIEDLIIESIRIFGHNIRYLPRTIVSENTLFGEAPLSTFNAAAEIEVYVKSVEGFEGEGDLFSKFNIEIRDQIVFTMARKRFDQCKTEKLLLENGALLVLEEGSTTTPSRQFLSQPVDNHNLLLEDGNGEGYTITSNRPMEGDLIYFPLVQKLFEIKHVEHESVFYQTGRLQTYDLRCELYEYSSERINTANTEIDILEDDYSLDTSFNQLLLETGDALLLESGGYVLVENRIEDRSPVANNEFYENPEFYGTSIVNKTMHPFGEP